MESKSNKLKINKKWLLLGVLPLIAAVWKFSDEYSSGYYHRPLSIQTELAANFGEVRENHYHLGLDIRTNGKENLPVYAAADGYVSRVSIEEWGYGKAIYIIHPNGTTTLYAHLNHFMDEVEKYVTAQQYKDECWQQNITFPPNQFPVTKGQRIAVSGNTGASEGPHLHFEIRDTRTGNNVNPLVNGITLTDNIAPTINSLYWYDKTGSIYNGEANKINIRGGDGVYTTTGNVINVSSPKIILGISALDKLAQAKYHLGIYKALLYVDGKLTFSFGVNAFNSNDTRYVNAGIDYASFINYSKTIQLLSILPGNHLPVFEGCPANGVIDLADKKLHAVKIAVSDAAGNTSTIVTQFQYNGDRRLTNNTANKQLLLIPGKVAHIITANAIINTGIKTVYDTVPLQIKTESNDERNAASKTIFIHDATVPLHDSMVVQLKTTLPAGSPLRKHVVMRLSNDKHVTIAKGVWKGDFMQSSFSGFGTVQLLIDTVSPVISLQEGDNCVLPAGQAALHIIYKDNMGEAAFFRGELDGHWILFEKKGDRFTYSIDEHCKPGAHNLRVIAGDKAGNTTMQNYRVQYR